MTHLYLITSTAAIPAGTRCRVFGQIHDGRTVLQTSDPLALDPLDPAISAWDGMQGNGIPIGIDDKTPDKWQVWVPEDDPGIAEINTLVDRINYFAETKTHETRKALLRVPILKTVNLYNSDGVGRIKEAR